MARIALPEPHLTGSVSVEAALRARRSVRDYADGPLTLQDVAQLLWAAQGITDRRGFRAAPSAGALYPLELYAVVGDVSDLAAGLYRYAPREHDLTLVAAGDLREELSRAALGQTWVLRAPLNLVFSAVPARITGHYGHRGWQYMYIEVGHAAENVYLQAVASGLGTVAVGAFHDDQVKRVCRLSDTEEPMYIMPVGRLRR
ncbi:MAG: SagB/ThcOx family dehydrogenase [Chloroflexi bacterium]|nr:SagB/ThcOx family dehydrogenase [Chloroflexota bacterium]